MHARSRVCHWSVASSYDAVRNTVPSVDGLLCMRAACDGLLLQLVDVAVWFLSRVGTLTRDIDIAILSVRPLRSGILWKRLKILLFFTTR